MRPHRRQPTRLPRPWDSPGKNTGVGCHFFSNAWKWKVKVKSLSRVRLLATPWTAAHQAPPSMGFSRQEYWCHCLLWQLRPCYLPIPHVIIYIYYLQPSILLPTALPLETTSLFSTCVCLFLFHELWVSHSVVPDSVTPWTAAPQAPLSMRFSRQGYWSGLPFPSPGDLPNPGIEPRSPALQAHSLPSDLQCSISSFKVRILVHLRGILWECNK